MTRALDYHQTTKHSFNRFARSLGYLDWAAQPNPFRRYDAAPTIDLPRAALRAGVPYSALFDGSAPSAPVTRESIGEFLRCAMGLSAWKQYQANRWALRVNPSSGNLHPTECYIVWGARVCHYAPREHALEIRADFQPRPSGDGDDERGHRVLVGLTSILWREAWKYGERAFRYCQHDVGHAIGALRFSAAMLGWQLTPLSAWSDDQIATLLGLDRDADYGGAEREEAECLFAVSPTDAAPEPAEAEDLLAAARGATWAGTANVLSRSHVSWPAIDDVAEATRKRTGETSRASGWGQAEGSRIETGRLPHGVGARQIILQRRSALGFDARTPMARHTFLSMLRRVVPVRPGGGHDKPAIPWDTLDWPPQVHLALFVHRVDGLTPGLYAFMRDDRAVAELRGAMRADFLWEPIEQGLFLLVPTDVTFAANRLSCDQDIASDGFFGLAMLARFEPALRAYGDWFYRRLFWECGLIGQVLYLEAEAAGARATGIGCFYDDPVHDTLGLQNMTWQSLYHFSMGVPVDDGRLTTDPGYPGGW